MFYKKTLSAEPKVNYVKTEPVAEKKEALKVKSFVKLPKKLDTAKRLPPVFLDKAKIVPEEKKVFGKTDNLLRPEFSEPDVIAVKKKITIPSFELEKISSPQYMNYSGLVREKIKRAAYQNYGGQDTGEINVSFIISSDGQLKDVKVIEEKSDFSEHLRQIAVASVRDASPFPSFPRELNYSQLSFNVVISFEIE
ncbi:MAG: TonB family protein [Candidatus Omnitrophica bacterium]|nr:TonB family protein [Candidatus Omnitrophota bacterium]